MIVQLLPNTQFKLIDIIIEEQAEYYGKRNAHVIAFFKHRMELTRENNRTQKQADAKSLRGGVGQK